VCKTHRHDHRFADRDMFARFAGIGVGHVAQFNQPMAPYIYDDVENGSDEQLEEFDGNGDHADSNMEDIYMSDSDLAEGDDNGSEDGTTSNSESESDDDDSDESDGEDLGFTF
jgi:hypothetical protein